MAGSQFNAGTEGGQAVARNFQMVSSLIELSHRMEMEKQNNIRQTMQVGQQMQERQLRIDHMKESLPIELETTKLNLAQQEQTLARQTRISEQGNAAYANVSAWEDTLLGIEDPDEIDALISEIRKVAGVGINDQNFKTWFDSFVKQAEGKKAEFIGSKVNALPPAYRAEGSPDGLKMLTEKYPQYTIQQDPGTGQYWVDRNTPSEESENLYFDFVDDIQVAIAEMDPEVRRQELSRIRGELKGQKLHRTHRESLQKLMAPKTATNGLMGAQQELRLKADEERLEDEITASTEVVAKIPKYDEALTLLKTIETGPVEQKVSEFQTLAKGFGWPLSEEQVEGLANRERLNTILGDFVMDRVSQTKGAVSEKEMDLFQQYASSPNKTTEGNRLILETLRKVAIREQELLNLKNDLRAKGYSYNQIKAAEQNWMAERGLTWEDDLGSLHKGTPDDDQSGFFTNDDIVNQAKSHGGTPRAPKRNRNN